jgi:Glycosyl transferase family 2
VSLRGPVLVSVVVPVHDNARCLERTLEVLEASDLPREQWELIVVDDASTDEAATIAARHADTSVRLRDEARGPAYARNRGIEVATGEFVAFIDADVHIAPSTLGAMLESLQVAPDVAAVSAVYDAGPAASGFITGYRNLLLHHLQQASRGAQLFSSACAMVRREALLHSGMFDEWRFPRPQVEDLELGHRLSVLGYRLQLRTDLQVTHLKRWTFAAAIASDVRDRAIPWMRVLGRRADANHVGLGLTTATPIRAVGLSATVALGVAGAVTRDARLLGGAAALGVVALAANAPLLARMVRARGVLFTLAAAPLHLFFELVNGLALAAGWFIYHLLGDPRPRPTIEAFAEVGVRTWPPVHSRRSTEAPPLGAPRS